MTIAAAVTRTPNWPATSAAALASAIAQPAALRPVSLMDLFSAATQAGADAAEFRQIWQFSEFVRRTESALLAGDLAGAQTLMAVCPVTWTPATLAGLTAALQSITLRAVDIVALERNEAPPTAVTAAAVTAAMNAAGYAWQSNRWTYSP